MDGTMREYLESRDALATEACEQLREVIYAFMDFQDELKRGVDEDEKYYDAYKNLHNKIFMAECFLVNGPFMNMKKKEE